ncbi:MAG: hypothetical protein IJX54_02770, partial [Oscillospiraceae bacterium]|nr:hypothetical protein [Oscillospiraceae bacterium]
CLLLLAMSVCVYAGCNETTPPNDTPDVVEPAENGLDNAIAYVKTAYKKAAENTAKDYQRVGKVPVGDTVYTVVWTTDVSEDLVKIEVAEDGLVTVIVNEGAEADTPYVLTATITDENGNVATHSWNHILPAGLNVDGLTYAQIVDMGYALADGEKNENTFRLFGKIVNIDTPWSADYKNITVTIAVAGKEDKPIMCYRLKGEGAKDLAVGDAITVEGTFKNYKGTIEYDAGCILVGYGEVKDQTALLDAAYALEDGLAFTDPCTLVGTIVKIDTAWSEDYQNITVTMDCGDPERLIMCYRLKGEGAKELAVGDCITVTGIMKNYKGTIEFDAGCTLDNVVKAKTDDAAEEVVVEAPSDPWEIVDAAYALEDGATLPYTATLTCAIVSVDTEYSADYGNVTVTIAVAGKEDKPIMCYRLKGEGADTIAVGDVITVTGTLKNYKGTIEFDAGCTLFVMPTEPAAIVEAAYALADGASLPQEATLTGAITSIDTEYSEQYGNITVTIEVEGKAIQCYRLKGEGAATLAVGDTITVTGTLKNYKGTIEFDAGCTLG